MPTQAWSWDVSIGGLSARRTEKETQMHEADAYMVAEVVVGYVLEWWQPHAKALVKIYSHPSRPPALMHALCKRHIALSATQPTS